MKKYIPLFLVILGQVLSASYLLWCFSGNECGLEAVAIMMSFGLLMLVGLVSGLVVYIKRLRRADDTLGTKVALFSVIILTVCFIPFTVSIDLLSHLNIFGESGLVGLFLFFVLEALMIFVFSLWVKRKWPISLLVAFLWTAPLVAIVSRIVGSDFKFDRFAFRSKPVQELLVAMFGGNILIKILLWAILFSAVYMIVQKVKSIDRTWLKVTFWLVFVILLVLGFFS